MVKSFSLDGLLLLVACCDAMLLMGDETDKIKDQQLELIFRLHEITDGSVCLY